jgi:tRNA-2-methylthio-N6-dimethylallyladenosine synthase
MSGRFLIRTFGCQMNQHDSDKLANLLYHQGYREADRAEEADLVLLQTCSVRDKAEQKLYSEVGQLAALKARRPGLLIGVGGCVAQQEGDRLLGRMPALDFVFGPQNLRHLPELLLAARRGDRALRVDYADEPTARFDLPERHPEYPPETPGRAFVTVMEGCDLHCTFCVVPTTRGREVSRPSAAILADVEAAAGRGAIEVTLLGQTVNAYGRPRPGRARDEVGFAELIRRVAAVPGIERIRFTSPHPLFVSDELIELYAVLPALCPHIHLPAQSGSSALLSAMNRRYDRAGYLDLVRRLRAARPDLAITTDLIVGFPGESEDDFRETLSLVEEARFADSFSFKYSPRPGTPATRRRLEPVEAGVARERLERLQALQRELTFDAHRARVGTATRVLIEGASRRGGGQRSGRCPYNRVVNLCAPSSVADGALVDVRITAATPHSLLGEAVESGSRFPVADASLPVL